MAENTDNSLKAEQAERFCWKSHASQGKGDAARAITKSLDKPTLP
jgi:hypothetical protein